MFHRCTSEQHKDDRTPSAHPSIRSQLTEACPWQLCSFRHGAVGWHCGGKVPDVHLDSFLDEPLPQDKINIQDKVCKMTLLTSTLLTLTSRA